MPVILSEETKTGKLVFEFSDRWQVCKYDEQTLYSKIKSKGIKGVDFLAISEENILLMEVKYITANDEQSRIRFSQNSDDERVREIKNKLTIEENALVKITTSRPYLVDEVVKKVKDTLLGLFASYRNNDADLSPYNQYPDKPISVLLFLERNEELNQVENFKPSASNLRLAIEQKLSFLGNIQVGVVNTLTLPPESGIKILQNTPGAFNKPTLSTNNE